MVGHYRQGVPTTAELENNYNNKYIINKSSPNKLHISKPICGLLVIGAILLAILSALTVFFLIPRCTKELSSQALTKITQNADVIDKRLPTTLRPIHYRIEIMPDLTNRTTSGNIAITFRANEETADILFNVKDITIDENSVDVRLIRSEEKLDVWKQLQLPSEQYQISIKTALKKDMDYLLQMKFYGKIDGHLQGFYQAEYTIFNDQAKTLLATQFSPIEARKAFPCFDEPSFKARFTISIARPSNMTTLSNMPLEENPQPIPDKPGWVWDRFPDTPVLPTYLVAFIISDLESYSFGDTLFKIWTTRETAHQVGFASQIAPKLMRFFEDYIDRRLPLKKIDLVALPEFGFGAMENWGLITFKERHLLLDKATSTVEDKRLIANVLGHELAHYWFGNLVTPKYWNSLWLKEGFATYFSYLGVQQVEPAWNAMEEFLPFEIARSFKADSLKSAFALGGEIKNNREIRQRFNEISYAKGASITRMMHHMLGNNLFKNCIKAYIKQFEFSNANEENLLDVFNQEIVKEKLFNNASLHEIMETWINKPGFPVLTTSHKDGVLTITQRRYLLNGQIDDTLWWVPISISTSDQFNASDTAPKIWLKNERTVKVDVRFSKWYILNINQTGYFIVNYDEANWRSLINHVMEVPPLTRAQLISDAMDLAKANLLDYDIPLQLIAKMATQDNAIWFIPTVTSFNKLEYLSDILSSTPAFGLFEQFHNRIFTKTYDNVDIETATTLPDDYLTQRILRTVLEWSCRSSESKCAIFAHEMFRKWMRNRIPVPANIRSIVYCTAIRKGSEAEWHFAYDEFSKTTSVVEKEIILDSLGCTTEQWLLSSYLNTLVTHDSISMKIQDADRIFGAVANNKYGSAIAFDFLRTHWKAIYQRLGEGFNIFNKLILSLPRYMNTKYQLAELEKFKEEIGSSVKGADNAFERSIEVVKANIDWMQNSYEAVEKWLKLHNRYDY